METSYSKMRGKLFDGKSEKSITKFGLDAPGELLFTSGQVLLYWPIAMQFGCI